jgi:glycerol-3-phosphate acyltransferase PlsY
MFPVWLGFKGGKGVATGIGVILALTPMVAALGIACWFIVAFVGRYSSLAALVASLHMPLYALALGHQTFALAYSGIAALIWLKHYGNIARLMAGTEGRIGGKK